MTSPTANVTKTVGALSSIIPLSPHTASSLKKLIVFTTEKKNVDDSKHLLTSLNKIKDSLPVQEGELDIEKHKTDLAFINSNLSVVNYVLDFVEHEFGLNTHDGCITEFVFDEPDMTTLLANYKEAKSIMLFISSYLSKIISIQEAISSIKSEEKYYSIEDILVAIK